ncbi:MAG: cupin domain-containing protein, partial [Candidatus Velamenicoccus archaeovorus]
MAHGVTTGTALVFEPIVDDYAEGLSAARLADVTQGLVHLDLALCELVPGGSVLGHRHPFEESFYVLSGEALVAMGGTSFAIGPDDFGVIPLGTPHAWRNGGEIPVRWLRVRSPQPKALGAARGVYPATVAVPDDGGAVPGGDPSNRLVGHFAVEQLPPPGPLAMQGYRDAGVRSLSTWTLLDGLLGAQHHTMLVIQAQPGPPPPPPGGEHFHPFEEAFYFVAGAATARLEGEEIPVRAGDLVFAGVGALHAFTNPGHEPARWIELQAPPPPPSGAFFMTKDWTL